MSRAEIIEELEGLGLHYSRPARSPDEHERFLRDYLEDLEGHTVQAIKFGCRAWRQSDATRFPKPGELLSMVGRAEPKGDSIPQVWREVSDAEYAQLPLSEKARHHRILASQCRTKAGPMWTNAGTKGRALTAEEMPPEYRIWIGQARNHDEEAARLEQKLRDARRKGAAG